MAWPRSFHSAALAAICAVGTFAASTAPAGAQAYRWKDENGIVHYGDVVPPKYRDQAQVELSRDGIPLRKVERALTPAERAAQEEKRKAEAIEAEKREAVDRLDRALMSKYANMRELQAAHDRELERSDEELAAFTSRAQDLSNAAFALLGIKTRNRDQRIELGKLSNDLAQVSEILDKKVKERSDKESRQRLERSRFQELAARRGGAPK
jgi:hypothetical protein